MFEQLAMMGVKFLGNSLQGLAAREEAKANERLTKAENRLAKANVEASNTVRDANNELATVVGSLNRYRQSLNDRQALRTSGREQEQIQTNLIRAIKDVSRGQLEQRLDTAFDLGSLAATTAAAGVGGGSKEVMNATIRMTAARRQAALAESGDTMTYDAMKLLTNTQADAYAQLDTSVIFDQLDMQVDQFIPKFARKAPSVGNVVFNAAVSTVTENPQLTQQTFGSFRSTGTQSYRSGGSDWAASVRV